MLLCKTNKRGSLAAGRHLCISWDSIMEPLSNVHSLVWKCDHCVSVSQTLLTHAYQSQSLNNLGSLQKEIINRLSFLIYLKRRGCSPFPPLSNLLRNRKEKSLGATVDQAWVQLKPISDPGLLRMTDNTFFSATTVWAMSILLSSAQSLFPELGGGSC